MINVVLALRENIGWIKNIFTIIFAGAGTIIAILTYKRARATILAPIRTEVIKKQSELLTEILNYFSLDGKNIDDGIDYYNIVACNVFLILKEYGFMLKGQDEIQKRIDAIVDGFIFNGDDNVVKDVELVPIFSGITNKPEDAPTEDFGKKKFDDAKKGIIEINKIYTTKKYHIFLKRFNNYIENPLLPRDILQKLNEISLDIHINITKCLKDVLTDFVKDFCNKYFNEKTTPKFYVDGVFNEFNHKKIHHQKRYDELKETIREYLLVDKKW